MPEFDLDTLRARQAAARAAAAAHASEDRPPHLDPHTIAACQLCDDDGYRASTVCDHTDHRAAAQRGMDLVRESMGWDTP